MNNSYFITLTGANYYYGMKPFKVGRVLKLKKDVENEYDDEAVSVLLPFIDKVGYVANSPHTVAKGTYSAGRIYNLFDDIAYAKVLFITKESVICELILKGEVKKDFLKEVLYKEEIQIPDDDIEKYYDKEFNPDSEMVNNNGG